MIINLNEQKVFDLIINNVIDIQDIDKSERTLFIASKGSSLLFYYFTNNNFKNIELLLEYEQIRKLFFNEIISFNKLPNINYLEKLPENNFITSFILSMSRQNFEIKQGMYKKLLPFIIENEEIMKKFFNIRLGEELASFSKGQPIGVFFLRMINENIEPLLDKDIISLDTFSITTKDTILHHLFQFSFETSKVIVDRIKNLDKKLKDKNNLNQTPVDKIVFYLREKDIQTLEYLFTEKLDLIVYKKEFIGYIAKCSNILKNKKTREALRNRVIESLELLFNLEQLQSNTILKEEVAKSIAHKCPVEVQYLWLSAKLPPKGIEEKKPKI